MPTPDGSTNLVYNVYITNAFGSLLSSNATIAIIPDKSRPVVTIASPLASARSTNFAFSGLATDLSEIAGVTYWITNINNGVIVSSRPAPATLQGTNLSRLTWSAAPDLSAGTNVLAVTSTDISSNVSLVATRTFFYQVPTPLTLTTGGNGAGAVTGKSTVAVARQPLPGIGTTNLFIGQSYSVQATPNATSYFTNWVTPNGVSTNPTFSFIMEPGFALQANFVTNLFIGMAGTYNGLYANTNLTNLETCGALRNLIVNNKGGYSCQLLVNGATYLLSGSFDMSGHAQKTIARTVAAGGPLVLDMSLDWNNTPRHLYGTVSAAGKWTSQLMADKASNTLANAQYTLVIPPATADAQHPAGYGYILITNRAGTVTLSGTLGDGTVVAPQTVPLSQDGRFPLFVSLYRNAGGIGGWVDLTSGTPVADLLWIKKASAGLYPQGFTNSISVLGSPWIKPSPGYAALPYPPTKPGVLEISGGDLTNSMVFNFAALTNNTLEMILILTPASNAIRASVTAAPQPFTGTIDPKTGLVKLTIVNGKARISATGAILQNSSTADGVFTGRTNSGSFTMHGIN